jgi:Bifunctional DNA primase/polymerase, N-terminal/Protein of unknown function (DUF3987)/Primase C terminal 1 (PriCT-1)
MFMNVSTIEKSVLTSALAYASLGYRVLPCHSVINGICTCGGRSGCKPGKHPLTAHGLKDATTDIAIITAWWEQWPFANVAIATGGSRWVLDVDPRHGGDTTMTTLVAQNGAIPPTPTVATGGGGNQFYLHYPPDVVIRSRSGVAEGIDVRGDGGYVIAPPSIHQSGVHYEWLTPLDIPLGVAPAWLLAMVAQRPTVKPEPNALANTGGGIVLTMCSAETGDFTTHAGEEEGKRNDTLCRLVGVHLSRGDSPATVEALAMAWAQRCQPPIPEDQVLRVLRWGEGKRVRTIDPTSELSDDIRTCPLISPIADASPTGTSIPNHQNQTLSESRACVNAVPKAGASHDDPNDWPTLHADAFCGLAGAIVKAIAPETEADPAAILLTLLTAFGNAVGNSPHYAMMDGTHHANLFTALVGDTASGKGRAWSIIHRLMAQADPEWEAESIAYGLSSGEGLVERVKDDSSDDDTADAFTIPSVKRLLCVEMEFARVITAMRREGNTLSPLLRSAWDSQTLEVLTRGKSKLLASNAHISVIAHITPEELAKLLSGSVEVCNGFSNRFLWACVKRSKSLPDGGDATVINPFVAPLSRALAMARSVGIVKRAEDAKALWHDMYDELTEAKPGAFGMTTSRGHAQSLRLSVLFDLLDVSDTITSEHLRAAVAVWKFCEASARRIFGGQQERGQVMVGQSQATVPLALHLRLLDAIAKSPGVSRRGLHEATGNRVKGEDMEAALAILEAQRLAHRVLCQTNGGGRPAECWWPGQSLSPDPSSGGFTFTMGSDNDNDVDAAAASSGQASGLGANEQTPATLTGGELVRSHSMFAEGDSGDGGKTPPPSPHLVSPIAGADAKPTDEAEAPFPEPLAPKNYPSPTLTSDDEPLPKCSCGAVVEQPGGDICFSCFNAGLSTLCEDD